MFDKLWFYTSSGLTIAPGSKRLASFQTRYMQYGSILSVKPGTLFPCVQCALLSPVQLTLQLAIRPYIAHSVAHVTDPTQSCIAVQLTVQLTIRLCISRYGPVQLAVQLTIRPQYSPLQPSMRCHRQSPPVEPCFNLMFIEQQKCFDNLLNVGRRARDKNQPFPFSLRWHSALFKFCPALYMLLKTLYIQISL